MSSKGNFPTRTTRQRQIAKEFDTFNQLDNVHFRAEWIGKDDRIQIKCWNSNTNITQVFLKIRQILLNGDIVTHRLTLPITSDRLESSNNFQIGIGWITAVMVDAEPALTKSGLTFIIADIFNIKDDLVIQHLISNYINEPFYPSWPDTPLIKSTDGPGFIHVLTGTEPVAGAEISETVPTNAKWKVYGVRLFLATDATVAIRRVQLRFGDGAVTFMQTHSAFQQTASQTRFYNCAMWGTAPVAALSQAYITIPYEIILDAGGTISTVTDSIAAGDDYTAPSLYIEEWLDVS